MAQQNDGEDVIALLHRQHQQIRQLFTDLDSSPAGKRGELFRSLVRLLAVHETVEEEVVHPEVRRLRDAEAVVQARIGEEHRAKRLLSTLDEIGPDAEGFDTLLLQLRDDVLAHAKHEEQEELPLLRGAVSPERLQTMAATVRVAEAIAPTHPHPNVEGATANLLLGPPIAIMDWARDAIRKAIGH